jgi:hypothetical protein
MYKRMMPFSPPFLTWKLNYSTTFARGSAGNLYATYSVQAASGNPIGSYKSGTGQIGNIEILAAAFTPIIRAVSGTSDIGTYIYNSPDTSAETSYSSGAFVYSARRYTGTDTLTAGNLYVINNAFSHRLSLTYDGQLRLGEGVVQSSSPDLRSFSAASIYVDGANANAYLNGAGAWCLTSTRASKMNIKGLSSQDAWTQLDQLAPVEFEYRQKKTLVRMKDGRELPYSDALAEAEKMALARVPQGEEMPPLAIPNALSEIVSGEPYHIWTDEGSGVKTQGFIAEDLPDSIAAPDHKSYAPALVTVANTAALKEAKRRIEAQEKEIEKLNARLAELEGTGPKDASAASAAALTQAEVEAVADRALVELGLLVEVEVAPADAFETVPETQTVEAVETVTRYRYDAATGAVEKFETQAIVQREQPTGQTVCRLRSGVRFDDTTGKFLRLTVAPTAPASETEGLAKLLAPALRARFAAALRTQSIQTPARTVSMNLK